MSKTTTKLPKNSNAADGKKAHFENKMYKVGRVRYNSWATAVLKSCDIVIFERELVHIQNHHGKELEAFGMTPLDFVKFVVSNFNSVYEGKENRKILVVKRPKMSHYSIIELAFDNKNYQIKTALSVETKRLSKWKLLFANIAH
jgi:hypothetical protein